VLNRSIQLPFTSICTARSRVKSGRFREASQVREVMRIDRHYMQPLASEGSELFDAICYRRCGMEAGPRQLEAEEETECQRSLSPLRSTFTEHSIITLGLHAPEHAVRARLRYRETCTVSTQR
jgi:hypothetical protein